jgi:hypothetical protein
MLVIEISIARIRNTPTHSLNEFIEFLLHCSLLRKRMYPHYQRQQDAQTDHHFLTEPGSITIQAHCTAILDCGEYDLEAISAPKWPSMDEGVHALASGTGHIPLLKGGGRAGTGASGVVRMNRHKELPNYGAAAEAVLWKLRARTLLEEIHKTISKTVADHPGCADTGAATPPSGGEYCSLLFITFHSHIRRPCLQQTQVLRFCLQRPSIHDGLAFQSFDSKPFLTHCPITQLHSPTTQTKHCRILWCAPCT